MSTESNADSSEDQENLDSVPLAHMVEVQPTDKSLQDAEDNSETCIDGADGIVDEEESNIGSVASVQSEEVEYDEETTFIVPEIVEPPEDLEDPDSNQATKDDQADDESLEQPNEQNHWPTLEILPGGVIMNRAAKSPSNITDDEAYMESRGKLYACAKCPESFKDLYSLVKHVKIHQEEERNKKAALRKLNQINNCTGPKSKVKRRIKSKTKARKTPKKS